MVSWDMAASLRLAFLADALQELRFGHDRYAEVPRFLQLAPGVFSGQQHIGLLRDAACHAPAVRLDELRRLVAREFGQRSREHKDLAAQRRPRNRSRLFEIKTVVAQSLDELLGRLVSEPRYYRLGDGLADPANRQDVVHGRLG